MTTTPFLRFPARSMLQSAADHMTEHLTALGWMTQGQVPFGASVVTIDTRRPFIGMKLNSEVVSDCTIAITLGTESPELFQELGGPLAQQDYPIFYDVFATKEAVCSALADDVKSILMARGGPQQRFLTIKDYAQVPPTVRSDWWVELTDVEKVIPEHNFPLNWQAVHATAESFFQETIY
jgi:hypothetical protein